MAAHGSTQRVALLIPFLLAGSTPVFAQEPSDVVLDASPQLFSVLYAVRAAESSSASGASSGPVEARVEEALGRMEPGTIAPLRDFFEEHPHLRPEGNLSTYVSMGLVLAPPPEFGWTLSERQLPPDVWEARAFLPLLREFYAQTQVAELWRRVRPYYERAIAEQQREVARLLLETRGYLRLIGESYPGRSYTVYLEWLVPPELLSARNYGESYFLVAHPQKAEAGFLEAVRHQYLHFLIDPLTAKYGERIRDWASLRSLAARAPRLPEMFREDLLLLATESLVQAVELRLRAPEPPEVDAELEERERSGYLLIRFFYDALQGFERAEPSLRYYFPDLLAGFNLERELARLQGVDFLPPPEEPTAPPEPTPEEESRRLLAEGEGALAAGDQQAARSNFQRVLEITPEEPRALYGLAILASLAEDRQQAKHYFLRALGRAREPHILGWAHVYLGRIYDLEGERQEALAHYRAALDIRVEKVREAARQGLERPFGERE